MAPHPPLPKNQKIKKPKKEKKNLNSTYHPMLSLPAQTRKKAGSSAVVFEVEVEVERRVGASSS